MLRFRFLVGFSLVTDSATEGASEATEASLCLRFRLEVRVGLDGAGRGWLELAAWAAFERLGAMMMMMIAEKGDAADQG